MTEAVIIGLLAFAAVAAWGFYQVLTASYGFQDEDGFHYGHEDGEDD